MTNNESIISKTVRSILIVLIPLLIVGWVGTYVAIRIALTEDRLYIISIKEDVRILKKDVEELKGINEEMWTEINKWNQNTEN